MFPPSPCFLLSLSLPLVDAVYLLPCDTCVPFVDRTGLLSPVVTGSLKPDCSVNVVPGNNSRSPNKGLVSNDEMLRSASQLGRMLCRCCIWEKAEKRGMIGDHHVRQCNVFWHSVLPCSVFALTPCSKVSLMLVFLCTSPSTVALLVPLCVQVGSLSVLYTQHIRCMGHSHDVVVCLTLIPNAGR